MNSCVYLSYVGLGVNLMHLSYCHQIALKEGPITIITICKNLSDALDDDPNIKKVIYLKDYYTFLKVGCLKMKTVPIKPDNVIIAFIHKA